MARSLAPLAAALLCMTPAFAWAQPKPAMTFKPAAPGNYSNSRGTTIKHIVIHKVEGSLSSCVNWFQNPSSNVSAHYVVDAAEIVQMLDDSRAAWHAGNSDYNADAIAIENAGYTYRDDVNDTHMRRLASLVAYLCGKHGLAATRSVIVGHNQVPTPGKPGKFGGSGQHEDPGPYFKWDLLMTYVQQAMGGSITVPVGTTPPKPTPTQGNGGNHAVAVNAAELNVRDAAWGTIIGSVAGDTAWVKTGKTDQGFVEVYFRGGHGWMSASYLKGYTGPGAEITTDNLNVRVNAVTTANVVGTVHTGQVYSRGDASANGEWVIIRYDQTKRWVYRSYTKDVSLIP
jgi:hypothetical protein